MQKQADLQEPDPKKTEQEKPPRKKYEPPRVVESAQFEGIALACSKDIPTSCFSLSS